MSTSSGWQLEGRVLGGGVGSPDTDLPEGCRYAPVETTNRTIQGKKYMAKTKQTTSFVS